MSRYPSEDNDQALARELVFNPSGLILFKIPQGAGRTPDFKLIRNGVAVAYCELKSPRDQWLDEDLDMIRAGKIASGSRCDPTFNRIRRLAQKAADQFRAVNASRSLPNILVFVNHDDASGFGDLAETFTGIFHATNGSRHVTMPQTASLLEHAKRHIDLCVWIDGKTRHVHGYYFNMGAVPNYSTDLCALLGKDPRDIKL